ncbi:putative reverse transcriptase domain-containing protein [Tanacetum coccineum]|uniref:Reverse transcriptase domain-containing protein n=1 Tax=Tanacetum coccineum TaxID=301880 RepID=A0ABQ5INI7_9ASTR
MTQKRTTRSTPVATTATTTTVTNSQLKAMIDQGVTAALAARDADRSMNGDDSYNSRTGGTEGVVELTQLFEKIETVFSISNCSMENQIKFSTYLKKKMIDKYCPSTDIKKLKAELWNLKVKGTNVIGYNQCFQELALMCVRMFPEESDKIKRYVGGLPDMIHESVVASKPKKMQEAIEIETELLDKKICTFAEHQKGFSKAENNNRGNEGGNSNASVLFDTGADRSFVSTAFSSQIDITPATLDQFYDVELANGRIIGLNVIIRGCTINFLNHPFNIDLMLVELGSLDVIIGMDWLAKYQAIIVCADKIIRIPWGNEALIVRGDESDRGNETRLNIILCTKTQKYMLKGCPIFLSHVTTKETEDKSEKKRLEDVPIIRNFPEVFPDDLPGLPLTRQVEFQIDLIPGAAPVARAPYQLASSEMKELSDQLKELSDKGFIRPSSSPWGAPVLFVKKKDRSL